MSSQEEQIVWNKRESSDKEVKEKKRRVVGRLERDFDRLYKVFEEGDVEEEEEERRECDVEGDVASLQGCLLGSLIILTNIALNSKDTDSTTMNRARKVKNSFDRANAALGALDPIPLPFNKIVEVEGYAIEALDYLGRYLVNVEKFNDVERLYVTVRVAYEGDFWKDGKNVKVKGYHLVGTNGTEEDVKDAARVMKSIQEKIQRDEKAYD